MSRTTGDWKYTGLPTMKKHAQLLLALPLIAVTGAGCALLIGLDEFTDAPPPSPDAGVCEPGTANACYAGPFETEGVGACRAGAMQCGDDGAWGVCTGEVLPAAKDDCFTASDENCDGFACGDVVWSRRYGDPSSQGATSVLATDDGGIIAVGAFTGTLVLDPLDPITAIDETDGFLVKLDASGIPQWQRVLAGPGDQLISSAALDTAGNIFIAGRLSDITDFGDGCPVLSAGMFVAQLDPMGRCRWSRQYSQGGTPTPFVTKHPSADEIVVAGTTWSSLDIGGQTLFHKGGADVFAAKLDATNGDTIWAKIYGDATDQRCNDIAIDANGSIFITGDFTGTLDLAESGGADALASFDTSKDAYLAKIQPDGALSWSKQYGQAADQTGWAVVIDSLNNPVIIGTFTGSVSMGAGTPTLSSAGYPASTKPDLFVAKVNSGGVGIWAKRFGDTEAEFPGQAAIDDDGNIIIGGVFFGEPAFGGPSLVNPDVSAGFLVKLTTDGEHIWSRGFGDSESTQVFNLAVGIPATRVIISVISDGSLDFGDGPLTTAGSNDIFLASFAL